MQLPGTNLRVSDDKANVEQRLSCFVRFKQVFHTNATEQLGTAQETEIYVRLGDTAALAVAK
jgi:hypothetical protein